MHDLRHKQLNNVEGVWCVIAQGRGGLYARCRGGGRGEKLQRLGVLVRMFCVHAELPGVTPRKSDWLCCCVQCSVLKARVFFYVCE